MVTPRFPLVIPNGHHRDHFPKAAEQWLATCDWTSSCHLSYTEHSEFVIALPKLTLIA